MRGAVAHFTSLFSKASTVPTVPAAAPASDLPAGPAGASALNPAIPRAVDLLTKEHANEPEILLSGEPRGLIAGGSGTTVREIHTPTRGGRVFPGSPVRCDRAGSARELNHGKGSEMLKVYGASDDLIEVEGDIRDEFSPRSSAEKDGVFLATSNGALVRIRYTGEWEIRVLAGEVKIDPSLGEDAGSRPDGDDNAGLTGYSDIATIAGNVEWVVIGECRRKR